MIARIDPGLLEHYASYLEQTVSDIRSKEANHIGQFAALNQFWQGEAYQSYRKREEEAAAMLRKFTQDSEAFVTQLRQKAGLARRIAEHRF